VCDDERVTPIIETTRLLLMPLAPADAAEMESVLADPGLYTFIGGGPPALAALTVQYDAWVAGSPRAGETWHNWVIRLRDGGAAVGHLQATVTEANSTDPANAQIAWIVGTPWQGRGYATEAAVALVDWLEANGMGVITAHVNPENVASARVAGRAGLRATDEVVDGETVWRRERENPGDA
jgi:RimJ/RimL family protein N-acetyltransferase